MRTKVATKPKAMRLLSLFLVFVMFITTQGFTSIAQTVSENEAIGENEIIGENGDVEDPEQTESQSVGTGENSDQSQNADLKDAEDGSGALTQSDSTSGNGIQTGNETPVNPVHNCNTEDGTQDTTTWSYVYFGSYPQSEVTDSATINKIENALKISPIKGDTGVDVWVDGVKYRRISKTDTNDDEYFDEVANNGYRYFKWERIKWRVLNNNGNTLFVVADKGLDCKDYNDEYTSITWENSTIRSWLNDSFYHTAFSSNEQNAIVAQTVVNNDNPDCGTEGGKNTTDEVYLLSIDEVANTTYGFCSNYDTYSASRWMQPSNYARARGTYTYSVSSTGNNDNCWWWLRSPGYSSNSAAGVSYDGYVRRSGFHVNYYHGAVLPALHINLSSGIWSMTDDGTSGDGGSINTATPTPKGPENPVHNCNTEDGTQDTTTWSYVYFGSYPQSEVTDSVTINKIENALKISPIKGDTGVDVWVDGVKYRRISKTDTNYSGYFDEVTNNGYRYFKWERIKWRVLDNNGSTLFVVADKGLDCKDYNDEYVEDIIWENSTLRNWLNNGFYNTAFSANEQNAIIAQNVVNNDNPYYGTEGGNNTTDKVYLLSIDEVKNEIYGFCSDYDNWSASRWIQPSTYARARGTSTYSDSSTGNNDNCYWWLRSPGGASYRAASVPNYGYVNRYGGDVDNYDGAVLPALHINLSSGIWSMTDDGTSGDGGSINTATPTPKDPENPVHNCNTEDGTQDTTTWSYVYFGSYPQSEVTDSVTINKIENALKISPIKGDTGVDVWVDGVKYRRISKTDTNYDEYFGEVANNGYRYFKWERIKWRVLNNNGSTLFVVADKGMDCKRYNDELIDVTWENSTIRSWLNDSFYHTAFSSNEQNVIVAQNVVNDDNPFYGTEGGNNTTDKVYLLSIDEVKNATYGFCSDYSTYSVSRWIQPSNYARARGTCIRSYSDTGNNDNCCWWLRSPGSDSVYAADVDDRGFVDRDGFSVEDNIGAVVPALHINLSSGIWSMTDDGTSGEGGSINNTTGNDNQNGNGSTNNNTGENPSPVKVQKLSITAPSKKLAAGKKVKLTLTVTPSNAANKAVTWKSSNKKYATVDKNGKITLKKAGAGKTVTITATAKDGSGKKATIKIEIMKHAVKSIKITAPSKTLKAGKSMKLKTTIKTTGKSVNKTLKWTSSNKKYATVNSKGKVTAKKAGKGKTVTITATATDGSNKKAKVKIKIK